MGENFKSSDASGRLAEPIAIVGVACRLPGEASSIEGLWDMMKNRRTAHSRIPETRWNADTWYHPDPDRKGTINSTHGFFLEEDISLFDAPFFSVNEKEAAGMDPAKRLLLEVAYEAFENAGMPLETVSGSMTGVYVGSMTSDYELLSTREIFDEPHMAAAGSSDAMTANRVSWFFDLRGPSLTLDTACSSSLVAMHLACQSLILGETNMSLVAGVNLILHPNFMQQLTAMHMLSPEGTSHTFDERANGYGRGEGIGAVILKPLCDAVRDGDMIRAIIRGSGTNVDGKTPSVTMPSTDAQADLIRRTYSEAGLPLNKTQYVELHGTGTPLGDPIELAAIASTFGACAQPNPVFVGSIKPSVGHTEGCAGLAGVFRALLSLEKGVILPTANVQNVNQNLKLSDWNLAIPAYVMAWPTAGLRRISINSFGFGGANAHIIIDDAYHYMKEHELNGLHSTLTHPGSDIIYPSIGANGVYPSAKRQNKLFVFTSQDDHGIARLSKTFESFLKSRQENEKINRNAPKSGFTYVDNVAYTLSSRRSIFDYRSFVVADSLDGFHQQLKKTPPQFKRSSKHDQIAFVFTGQGAQFASMGKQLLEFAIFENSIIRSGFYLNALGCSWNLLVELCRTQDSKIDLPEYSQPICTALQIALVDLLNDWSIKPKAVVGHSSGEIAAAFAAGIISREDALKIAYFRGIYSAKVSQCSRIGAMLAVGVSEHDAEEYLKLVDTPGDAVVACINSPKSVTLSGDATLISELETAISRDGKFARKLRVKTAYHSPHMGIVAEECLVAMKNINILPPKVTSTLMFSSVTGKLAVHEELDASYWIRNMCQPVRFSEAMNSLLTYSPSPKRRVSRRAPMKWIAFIEIGPHSALKAPATQNMEAIDANLSTELQYLSMITRGDNSTATSLRCAGTMWALGSPVDIARVNQEYKSTVKPRIVVDLPSYPWNHKKQFWHETKASKMLRLAPLPRTDLLGMAVENQNPFEPMWKNFIRIRENPWIDDHKITNTILYPGAGMLIMALEAAHQLAPKEPKLKGIELWDVSFARGLVIPNEGAVETLLSIQCPKDQGSNYTFTVYSISGDAPWIKHCSGSFSYVFHQTLNCLQNDNISFGWQQRTLAYEGIKKSATKSLHVEKLYRDLWSVGMEYGPTFQNLTAVSVSQNTGSSCGTIRIPNTKSVMPYEFEYSHLIHPATLDAIFHLIVVASADDGSIKDAAVPVRFEKMFIAAELPHSVGTLFSGYSQRTARMGTEITADLVVSDETWEEPKIILTGLVMKQVTASDADVNITAAAASGIAKRCTQVAWKPDLHSFVNEASSDVPPNTALKNVTKLSDWLEMECHGSSDLSVLLVGASLGPETFKKFEPLGGETSKYRGFRHCIITDISNPALELWRAQNASQKLDIQYQLWDSTSGESFPVKGAKFDIIIMGSLKEFEAFSGPSLVWWKLLLRPKGRLLVSYAHDCINRQPEGYGQTMDNLNMRHISLQDESLTVASFRQEIETKQKSIVLLESEIMGGSAYIKLRDNLQDLLQRCGFFVQKAVITDFKALKGQYIISLIDLVNPFVINWTADQFQDFQRLVDSVAHMFWITRGNQIGSSVECGVDFSPMTGLLRVLRNEFPGTILVQLDLSPSLEISMPTSAKLIFNAWLSSTSEENEENDLELAECDGHIFLPRAVEEPGFDSEIALHTGSGEPVLTPVSVTRPLQLEMIERATPDLIWEDDMDSTESLESDQIDICTTSISLPIDSSGENGEATYLDMLGSQLTGIVHKCGSGVTEFAKGDLVMVLGGTRCRTRIRQHCSKVQKIPDCLQPEAWATTAWLHMVASYALKHVARLVSGQYVLIQQVTSINKVLVSLSLFLDANVFVVVQSEQEKKQLVEDFGICYDHIIDSRDSNFAPYLLHKTNGEGVDVVLTSASELADANDLSSCISNYGHIVAFVDGPDALRLSSRLLRRNLNFSTIDQNYILKSDSKLVAELLKEIPELVRQGAIKEIVSETRFGISKISEAVDWAHKSESNGILTIEFSDGELVPLMPSKPPPLELDSNGTYILAGGLGSLGLRIADLMFQHDAKHIIVLSRSGGGRFMKNVQEMRERRQGCIIEVLKCDVTVLSEVKEMMHRVQQFGRKIRGFFQCAMVLQDSLFTKMKYSQWQAAFNPKVNGTKNLHSVLPKDLDFFIMLSSVVSIIGNISQANYAAGNSYMDAFAHYRRRLGLSAISINVGLVSDSDHIIDGTNMEDYLDRFSHMASVSTTLGELDIGLIAAMRGSLANGEDIGPQIVFGMTDTLRREGLVIDQWTRDRKFDHRVQLRDASEEPSSVANIKDVIAAMNSIEEAAQKVQDILKQSLAPGLGVQPADIDEEKPLYDIGVDSFKAVEIRNQVFRDFKSDLSVFEILSATPLAQLSILIADRSQFFNSSSNTANSEE